MYLKKLLMIGALLVGGAASSLALPDTADARPRYRGGGYGYGGYYGRSYYRPYRSYSYGYRPYYSGYYSYRPYYGGGYYNSYRPYYGGYGYGGYGGGVYVGRGGISIGW